MISPQRIRWSRKKNTVSARITRLMHEPADTRGCPPPRFLIHPGCIGFLTFASPAQGGLSVGRQREMEEQITFALRQADSASRVTTGTCVTRVRAEASSFCSPPTDPLKRPFTSRQSSMPNAPSAAFDGCDAWITTTTGPARTHQRIARTRSRLTHRKTVAEVRLTGRFLSSGNAAVTLKSGR